jgi:hypothetical protein
MWSQPAYRNERYHCWSQRERRGKALLVDIEEQKIQPERLIGQLADCGRASANLVDLHTSTAQRAETTGIRNSGDKLRRVDRGHTSKRDRVFDLQDVADRRVNHPEPLR